jgi:CelD/BcsL family acetyltransferase involved in cellulose biosynthesis
MSPAAAITHERDHREILSGQIRMHLCVDGISDFDSFVKAKPAWDQLVEKISIGHPFLTHDWIRSWWESFGVKRALKILMVSHAGELIGIAPLMISRTKIYGIPVRELGSISNDHTPRFDFIISSEPASVMEAMWLHLWERRREWDVMKLCQLESGSATLEHLAGLAAGHSCRLETWPSTDSPYLSLNGSFEDHLAKLPRGLRANLRRRMKRLEEIGPVEFEQVFSETSSKTTIDDALTDAFRMEAGTWKGEAGTAIACHQELSRFYSSVVHRAARQGTLYLTFLRLNGQRIAFDLSLIYQRRLFKLKPGYLQRYHACSPGQELTTMTIRDAFARGLSEVDFLGSADEWKLAWTKTVRQQCWAYVFKKDLLGSLLHFAKFRLAPWVRSKIRGKRAARA